MSVESPPVAFGQFTLDCERGELRADGSLVKIRHQTLQLLCYLANRPGQTVSRDELATHLWGSADIDFDQRLNAAIRDLRKTLEQDSNKEFVHTIPRQGYRFVCARQPSDQFLSPVKLGSAAAVVIIGILAFWWLQPPTNSVLEFSPVLQASYIEAKSLLDAGDPVHHAKVQTLLEQVVTEAPNHADAWASLAKLHMYCSTRPDDAFPQAEHAAHQALNLEPDNIEALIQASTVAVTWQRDWDSAEKHLQRALQLAPGSAKVFHAYAALYYLRGDSTEGDKMMSKGLAVDPLSLVIHADLVWYQTVNGEYERAIDTCNLIDEIKPSRNTGCALYPHLLMGNVEKAASMAREILMHAGVMEADAILSDDASLQLFWQTQLDQMGKADNYIDPVNIASMQARLGRPGPALDALEQAVEDRSLFAPYIHLFPEFRALHNNQRFIALVKRTGVPNVRSTMVKLEP